MKLKQSDFSGAGATEDHVMAHIAIDFDGTVANTSMAKQE